MSVLQRSPILDIEAGLATVEDLAAAHESMQAPGYRLADRMRV